MEPVRTLIVDDEPMARAHLRSLLEARGDIAVVGEAGDGNRAVELIRQLAPELVLLDVQMPELNGFEVVRSVGVERMPAVVFVTAYDQHALAAFEVHALDYILKPVNRIRFTQAMDRVVNLVRAGVPGPGSHSLARLLDELATLRSSAQRLAVKAGDRVLYLKVSEIDWIEAADDSVRIHIGRQVYQHRATMAELEDRLRGSSFMRIHRSTIVNVERIREFQPWFQGDWIVVLADGTRLQSGKRYRQRIKALLER